MKVSFLVFCDAATLTQDGKFVLHGVFKNIFAKQFPATHPVVSVVYQIEKGQLKQGDKIDFVLEGADGKKEIFKHTKEVTEVVGDNAVGQIINLVGLKLESAGDYKGKLIVNDKEIATSILEVKNLE